MRLRVERRFRRKTALPLFIFTHDQGEAIDNVRIESAVCLLEKYSKVAVPITLT